jgi:two-component system, NtrC family, sensor kinase
MKVLIADDDPVSRRLLESYLRKWEYEVEVTTDGEQAWQRIQDGEFPIVICDWMMPKVDGPELIRRIREQGQKGMKSGADEFVSKPFDHDELHARLRAAERIVNLERSLRAARAVVERDATG